MFHVRDFYKVGWQALPMLWIHSEDKTKRYEDKTPIKSTTYWKYLLWKKETNKSKVIVLKPNADRQKMDELIDSKKTTCFRHLFQKPQKNEIHVHSVTLTYEPFMIASGRYEAGFLRKATHQIKVDHNIREIILGESVFPINHKSTFVEKLGRKHGKNKIELEVDEHVFVIKAKEMTLDHHGTERVFRYKINSESKENYPKQVIGKNIVKEFEVTTESAVKMLEEKLREESFDYQVKNLNEQFSLDSIMDVCSYL